LYCAYDNQHLHSFPTRRSSDLISKSVTDDAKRKLVSLGYDKRFGARPLRRVIQDRIEDQLTDLILEEDNLEQVKAHIKDGEIVRSEEHTSELQSRFDLVCRLLL